MPAQPASDTEVQRASVERWFVGRGLPHLIADYNAREDIFTRATPLLTVVFLAEVLVGINRRYEWWANALSLIAAVGIALGGIAVVNRLRGRRLLQRPDTIGGIELAGFVVVPALFALVAEQPDQAVAVVAFNLVFLAVVFVFTSYGVVPTAWWGLRHAAHQITSVVNLMARSLGLLLVFTMFMFVNAELWKVVDDLPEVLWWAAVGLLALVGSAFVAFRTPRELEGLSDLRSWHEVAVAVEDTPAAGIDLEGLVEPPAPPEVPPLRRRERLNVALVFFVSQAVQILLVTAVIFVFYVVFGVIIINDTTLEQWTGSPSIDVLARWPVGDAEVLLTVELLATAGFVAAIAGLQFTVAALTDASYREEFLEGTLGELRESLAVRAAYRARLGAGEG